MSKRSDQDIIASIKEGGIAREKASAWLYKEHIRYSMMKMKGVFLKPEERRDAYNWTLSKVVQHVATGKFKGGSKLSTFIFESYRNSCIDKQRSNTSDKATHFKAALETWADHLPKIAQERWTGMNIEQMDLWARTKEALKQLGDKCRELIWKIDFLGYSLKEVAEHMDYSSAGSVATSKNRCMKELRGMMGV
ncbi:MAG: sigma-70 family RNA polymerase sigma factor [Bacteroidota bacterium]